MSDACLKPRVIFKKNCFRPKTSAFSFKIANGMKVQLFSLVALALLPCLFVSQPSEECSLRNLLTEINVAEIFKGVDVNATETATTTSTTPGAILTVWAGPIPDAYSCQVN